MRDKQMHDRERDNCDDGREEISRGREKWRKVEQELSAHFQPPNQDLMAQNEKLRDPYEK